MIVLVYLRVVLRELLVSTIFLHGPSLHRHSFSCLHLLYIFFALRRTQRTLMPHLARVI